jgi:hypothetical protein
VQAERVIRIAQQRCTLLMAAVTRELIGGSLAEQSRR